MKSNKEITAGATFAQKAGYYSLYNLFKAIGWLPAWFLYYPLAGAIYFTLYYVTRYRLKVTRENLHNSFPEKSVKELRIIERKFYRHLSEIFVDTIDLASITPAQLRRRMVIINEDGHRREVSGKDWISAMAHYGTWEYFIAYALNQEAGSETIAVYKTLHSKIMDMYYQKIRSRMNSAPVSMTLFLRHVLRSRSEGTKMSIGMISDQSPQWFTIDHWYDFMGQPTAFFSGMETVALRFNMPVYFMHVEKTGKAHYTGRFECIYDGVEKVEPHEITARYAAQLESMIRRRPELWVWSHKRWKHKPKPTREETKCEA